MSEKAARLVQEFRGTVDAVIANSVSDIESRPSRPIGGISYKKSAKFGGLHFVSLDQRDGRWTGLPFSEQHMWGVLSGELNVPLSLASRMAARTGWLAVVSTADKPDTLSRRFTFNSAMQMIDVPTAIPLETDEQLEDALTWAKTPHMASAAVGRLAVLMPEEIESVTPRLAEIAESQRKLDEDLKALANMRRQSWAEARDVILD
jgi:hypothetical protein